jgi:23S rRNA (cytidine1920-2'-O)/16S rRNA (cytidine1409-2'-O)-methyltransferase
MHLPTSTAPESRRTKHQVVRRARLDAELVRRGLARSRNQAAELVVAGRVRVAGQVASKVATAVGPDDALLVSDADQPTFVSRGAHKLVGAITAFAPVGLEIAGKRCLDAGASTGGFTQVLLASGARTVIAVDVGYGQLAWSLQTDERVIVVDRTNVRDLTLGVVGDPVELVVADLSFIPLGLVLPALVRVAEPHADLVVMVKPQFEVGREHVGAGGVVRDPLLHAVAVRAVADAAAAQGLGVRAVVASPLPGPAGNVEYFLWLRAGAAPLDESDLARAIAEAPTTRGQRP